MEFFQNCLMSRKIAPVLSTPSDITYPTFLDNRDKLLKPNNQNTTPTCAAHTCCSYIESINWKITGKEIDLDPYLLYDYAKKIDGYPGVDGTTLEAVLSGAIHFGWINRSEEDIYCFNTVNELKRMLHKYEIVLTAFTCSELWMKQPSGRLLLDGEPGRSFGGHAVICTGYRPEGLYIQNSWGPEWAKDGFACISWDLVEKQFQYGAVIKNCLNDLN